MRRKGRFAVLTALVVLALTGCGTNFHPGEAVIINGQGISTSRVDDLVLAACDYSTRVRLSQGGAVPTQSMASLRSNLTQALVQFAITDKAAQQLGITVSDAKIASLTAGSTMPAGISSTTRSLLTEFFRQSAKAQLEQAVIGAHLRDPKITNADSVTANDPQTQNDLKAAAPYLDKFARQQHVIVDPSFGKWNGTALVPASGSLSDRVSATPTPSTSDPAAAVKDLPPSQVCG